MADEERPKRRRWWLWLLLGLVVVVAVTVGSSSLGNREYAFLNRFQPVVEPWQAPAPVPRVKNYKGFLYIFGKGAMKDVTEAMNRELTSAKGYRRLTGDDFGEVVSFDRSVGGESYGAALIKPNSMAMTLLLSREERDKIPSDGCAVLVIREPTWLERQLDALKKLLHWD